LRRCNHYQHLRFIARQTEKSGMAERQLPSAGIGQSFNESHEGCEHLARIFAARVAERPVDGRGSASKRPINKRPGQG
jgi:hypothetical protein